MSNPFKEEKKSPEEDSQEEGDIVSPEMRSGMRNENLQNLIRKLNTSIKSETNSSINRDSEGHQIIDDFYSSEEN